MGALAGLVARGLVAPDWAEALAPVDDRIAAMGEFLRNELRAGRSYLPQGDHVFRAGFIDDPYVKGLASKEWYDNKKNKFFDSITFIGPYPSKVEKASRKKIDHQL